MATRDWVLGLGLGVAALASHCGGGRVLTRTEVPSPAPFVEEAVRYRSGEYVLAAALLRPSAQPPFPGVVFIQGSGDSDRTNRWARDIAEALARRGIAVLLTDKRGAGLSQGDWHTANFEDLAHDALAGVAFMREFPEVEPGEVGLIGLSQGGQVAPLAASISDAVDFVVSVSSTATTPVEQIDHEMRNTFRQAGLDDEQVSRAMRLQTLAGEFLVTGRFDPYEQALTEALESDLAAVAEGFPRTRESWVWGWWRGVLDYDPIPYWRESAQPILAVFGELDEQDNVPVAASVRGLEQALAGRSIPYHIRVFEGSGHALYEPDGERPEIRHDFLQLLVEWIHFYTQNELVRGRTYDAPESWPPSADVARTRSDR